MESLEIHDNVAVDCSEGGWTTISGIGPNGEDYLIRIAPEASAVLYRRLSEFAAGAFSGDLEE